MREIGSEFWNIPLQSIGNDVFPPSTEWFLSGRSALLAVIKNLSGKTSIAMPSWCCESMIKPFVNAGMQVRFYPVYFKDGEVIQEVRTDCDVLFLMDYFGYTQRETRIPCLTGGQLRDTTEWNKSHPCVIRDVTHSLFSGTYSDADYYFGSLRKWCGIWTGGYAWTKQGHPLFCCDMEEKAEGKKYVSLRKQAMEEKLIYISDETSADKGFLKIFQKAEEILEKSGICEADKRDIVCAEKLDVGYITSRRRANAKILMDAFPEWIIYRTLSDSDCPMFVPVLVPGGQRDQLKKYLMENGIYCPVHWPVSKYHDLDDQTGFLYNNELSLVCDQRYTKEDMYRIVDVIQGFVRRGNGTG